jgi:methylglutaconyl-CoA hydratase
MKKMAGYSNDENRADALTLAQMLHTIWSCPKPVIARVHGDTYAGGVGLVAACDVAVAAEGVNFCLSEARLGLLPATISPYVIRAMGEQAARRYFITAERFDAAEALRIGFVHATVPARARQGGRTGRDAGRQQPERRARKQAAGAGRGRPPHRQGPADRYRGPIAVIRASEEGREGVRSFLEKRAPAWKPQ